MSEQHVLSWKHREENLRKIKRYGKFAVMFYRTNDLIHSQRVCSIVREVSPFIKSLYPDYAMKKAELIATHHDDHELVLKGGDISLQLKLMMSEEELHSLQQDELAAVDLLSENFPKKVKGYNYKQLLHHAIFKDCLEAQLVSYIDKVDGYCEAIHENLACNPIFMEPIINYDLKTFGDLHKKFPLLREAFNSNHNFFDFAVVDLLDFFKNGKEAPRLHTEKNLKRKASIPQYELWKHISIKTFGVGPLVNQVEFYEPSDD